MYLYWGLHLILITIDMMYVYGVTQSHIVLYMNLILFIENL